MAHGMVSEMAQGTCEVTRAGEVLLDPAAALRHIRFLTGDEQLPVWVLVGPEEECRTEAQAAHAALQVYLQRLPRR